MTGTAPDVNAPARARNPISVIGVGLTTAGAVAFLTYFVADSLGLIENPYAGIFGYVALPAVFGAGLLLIPFGIWREKRRRAKGREAWTWPVLDLGSRMTRRVAAAVGLLTLVNLGIVAVAGFGAAHYMESNEFCGQVCHEPMKPQFVAHQVGAHSAVRCVSCHVGPGAAGAVRAKLAGTRQLYQVATRSVPRPIHAEGRVPAADDTCAGCHRPGFTPRDTTRVFREYAEDEANTETVTTFDMLTTRTHNVHANAGIRVEYAVSSSDPNVVTYVRATRAGDITEYFGAGVSAQPSGLRTMDCLDCHSRPAHAFSSTVERAVNNAIGSGGLNRSLAFIRREAVAALKTEFDSEAAALAGISRHLNGFYGPRNVASTDLTAAIREVQRLYSTNVFPEMKVTWGTHVVQSGHTDFAGCFRCHTDEHKAKSGKVISQDCELCHKQR